MSDSIVEIQNGATPIGPVSPFIDDPKTPARLADVKEEKPINEIKELAKLRSLLGGTQTVSETDEPKSDPLLPYWEDSIHLDLRYSPAFGLGGKVEFREPGAWPGLVGETGIGLFWSHLFETDENSTPGKQIVDRDLAMIEARVEYTFFTRRHFFDLGVEGAAGIGILLEKEAEEKSAGPGSPTVRESDSTIDPAGLLRLGVTAEAYPIPQSGFGIEASFGIEIFSGGSENLGIEKYFILGVNIPY